MNASAFAAVLAAMTVREWRRVLIIEWRSRMRYIAFEQAEAEYRYITTFLRLP